MSPTSAVRLAALCLLTLLGCEESRLIDVHVRWPAGLEVRSLRTEFAYRAEAQQPLAPLLGGSVYQRPDHFQVRVPVQLQGEVSLRVIGRNASQCRVAERSVPIPLSLGLPSIDVELAAAEGGCQIVLRRAGDGQGSVTDAAAAIERRWSASPSDQGREHVIPLAFGERLRLTARGEGSPPDHFTGWAGACHGLGDCAVTAGDEPVRVVVGLVRRAICRDAFCWQNPLPQGGDLRGALALAADDAWAVGDSGLILHWNGAFWAPVPLPQDVPVSGRFALSRVWAARPDDVWVVGTGGLVLRGDAQALRRVESGTKLAITSITGSGPDDVWAVGNSGAVLRWQGGAFERVPSGTTADLNAVWSGADGEIWAAGDGGVLLRGTASGLAPVPSGTTSDLTDLWSDGSDLWVVGADRDQLGGVVLRRRGAGGAFEVQRRDRPLYGVWGSAASDVWLVGGNDTLLRWDGEALRPVDSDAGNDSQGVIFTAVAGHGRDDVWFVGTSGGIRHFNGAFVARHGSGPRVDLTSVWANSEEDVWATGVGGTLLYAEGQTWLRTPVSLPADLLDVWGGKVGQVFVVGALGTFFQYAWPARTLTKIESGTSQNLTSVWGFTDPLEVWAVGTGGTAIRWDGTTARATPTGVKEHLRAVWGRARDDLWAVGHRGTILHYDGSTWKAVPSGTTKHLTTLWGLPQAQGGETWVAGDGVLLTFAKGSLIPGPPGGEDFTFISLFAREASTLLFSASVGDFSGLFQISASSEGQVGPWQSFSALHGLPSGALWAVGPGGAIVHRAGRRP